MRLVGKRDICDSASWKLLENYIYRSVYCKFSIPIGIFARGLSKKYSLWAKSPKFHTPFTKELPLCYLIKGVFLQCVFRYNVL